MRLNYTLPTLDIMQSPCNTDSERDRFIAAFLSPVGNILEVDRLPRDAPLVHTLSQRANQLCSRVAATGNSEAIPFRFLQQSEINAFAISGIVDCIAVNAGAPFALFDLFCRIMCWEQAFPHIGNRAAQRYTDSRTPLPTSVDFTTPAATRPKCIVRSAAAFLLTRVAFDFLIGHEVGHITRGHMTSAIATSFRVLAERHAVASDGGVRAQALELDADVQGMRRAFESVTNTYLALQQRHKWKLASHTAAAVGLAKSRHRVVFTTVFAVWVMFRTFQEETGRAVGELSHPPLTIRRNTIVNALLGHIATRPATGVPREVAERIARRAIEKAEAAIDHVTGGQPGRWDQFSPSELASHSDTLLLTLATLQSAFAAHELSAFSARARYDAA